MKNTDVFFWGTQYRTLTKLSLNRNMEEYIFFLLRKKNLYFKYIE